MGNLHDGHLALVKQGVQGWRPIPRAELLDAEVPPEETGALLLLLRGRDPLRPTTPRALLELARLGASVQWGESDERAQLHIPELTTRFVGAQGARRLVPVLDGQPVEPEWCSGAALAQDVLVASLPEVPQGQPRTLWVRSLAPQEARLVESLRQRHVELTPETLAPLVSHLDTLKQVAHLEVDDSLLGQRLPPQDHWVLRLEVLGANAGLQVSLWCRPLEAAAPVEPGVGAALLWAPTSVEQSVHTYRDLATERLRAEARWSALGLTVPIEPKPDEPEPESEPEPGLEPEPGEAQGVWQPIPLRAVLSSEDALAFARRLEESPPSTGLTVEWSKGKRVRVIKLEETEYLDVEVLAKRDWFALSGSLGSDLGPIPLAQVLAAIRDGRRYIEVKPGEFAELNDKLAARLRPAASVTWEGAQGLEVSRAAAPALDDLLEGATHAKIDAAFQRLRQRALILLDRHANGPATRRQNG